ncbi:unnamed protein product [Candida verbasci]|uniref:alpha-1,2-Mannosidase n=1 Tax=Candida verbasci TaxID=1227364 RepID=A0A9W4XFC6_9ASCO|nr:unnamed protein product [Candida verbasci]
MLLKRLSSVIFIHLILLCTFINALDSLSFNSSFTKEHLRSLSNETKSLFIHGWDSYMKYGFPFDEVRPITCEAYGPDYKNVENSVRNDAMGNISSTVLDNLDTLIIMKEYDQLEYVLSYLKENQVGLFDQNTIVQVFETTIRHLGGLLSAHIILTDLFKNKVKGYEGIRKIVENYDGFLLDMAYDLGLKLIPSYKTSTNIPVPRINLLKGLKSVPPSLQRDACTSGATTPILEFTLLSKLTGDYQFQYYTSLTWWKLWSSKSELNLLPMTIDPISNQWKDSITGIGASIDSFYEYAAKSSILFNDDSMWNVYTTSYKALLTHSAQGGLGSLIFPNININDGVVFSDWIDSLSAFWSGLQVLTGQLTDAIRTHVVYMKIWNTFESIPERWIFQHFDNKKKLKKKVFKADDSINLEWYPLRPEFIESTYYLYRATKDPMYLNIGERILHLLKTKYSAPCGLCGLQNIKNGIRQNRMETFVLGETLKYLYLLFDEENEVFLHQDFMKGKNWIFSTEAHPLWLDKNMDKLKDNKTIFIDSHDNVTISNKELISKPISSFYRNVSIVQPFYVDINNENVYKIDPFAERFNYCQLNPWQKSPNSFLESSYYRWNAFFSSDYSFKNSLIKPRYLPQTSLDGSTMELNRNFYDKFTMFDTDLICPRVATTLFYEVFWGDIKLINEVEVSEIVSNDTLMLSNDLWVPNLYGLRIVVEELVIDKVDSFNTVITEEYINSLQHQQESEIKFEKAVLRIKKINGVNLYSNQIVWTLPFEANNEEKSAIGITDDGRLIIQGKVVENLLVYYS